MWVVMSHLQVLRTPLPDQALGHLQGMWQEVWFVTSSTIFTYVSNVNFVGAGHRCSGKNASPNCINVDAKIRQS